MAIYAFDNFGAVIRTNSDNSRTSIPVDPGNENYREYQAWLAAGGVTDPFVTAPPRDALDAWDIITLKIAFAHENRLRTLESKAPVTVAQFKAAVKAMP
jgi:hypothetical protein